MNADEAEVKRLIAALGEAAVELPTEGILELDEILERIERDDPRKARIVKLRYFAGMSVDETASALELSEATVRRECRYVKALLAARLEGPRDEA